MGEIPKAVAKRIIRNAGNKDTRVSDGAAVEMAERLEKVGTEIAKNAIETAGHLHRQTVKNVDITWAVEHM